jgi:ATPase family associated with various cellular activities (AAA)
VSVPGDVDFFSRVGQRRSNGSAAPPAYPTVGMAPQPSPYPAPPHVDHVSCWAQSDNLFYGIGTAHSALPSNVYRCGISDRHGPVFIGQTIELDGIVCLPDSAGDAVLREVQEFRGMKSRFVEHGFLHKRGVLLWGPPGSGKTITVHQVCRLIVDTESGLALMVDDPHTTAACLQLLRRIEPDRPVVVVFEDLDALVRRFGESEYLALLDGEAQVNNVVYLATTNYPEDLDPRFVDRPSRFDTVRYIGMPSREARTVFLQAKAPALVNGRLEEFVEASDGFSVAHLKELVVLTQCFGYSLEDAAGRLRKMRVTPRSDRAPDYARPGL